ncbi:unnamed protein product [Anisakis simplex]|uniref:Calponin-homology (CH) domain-containing protein n=1 Tax=Anisakis simplex TaxID=6269 RepID=A0A0M3JYI0_ANISI|nr:unnamed protein product [Anisakis simplex]
MERVEDWLAFAKSRQTSESVFPNEIALEEDKTVLRNMQEMLDHLHAHLSKDGHSQLKRLVGNLHNPEQSKRMKPVSLGELNTADLCFIIAIMFEQRLRFVDAENAELRILLERAHHRIGRLEVEVHNMKHPNPKNSSITGPHPKMSTVQYKREMSSDETKTSCNDQ